MNKNIALLKLVRRLEKTMKLVFEDFIVGDLVENVIYENLFVVISKTKNSLKLTQLTKTNYETASVVGSVYILEYVSDQYLAKYWKKL